MIVQYEGVFSIMSRTVSAGLEVHGLVRVSEVPEFTLQKLLDRAGFARKTHYLDVFEVKSKGDPNNLAYTSGTLGLHVDLPYYKYTPGVGEHRTSWYTKTTVSVTL